MAEKTFNDLPRDVRVLYTRGTDAALRENFDYAIDLLNQVLTREPAFFEGRKSLRTAQLHKAGKGSGIFKKVWSSASSSPLIAKGQIQVRTDPAGALHVAEQILNNDPMNSGAHKIIYEAAKSLELPQTAVLSLELLFKNSPRDKEVAVQLANALADIGEVDRAERVMTEICRTYPTDSDLSQALKNVSARRTMDEGGYDSLADGKGSYRDILKDKEEAVALEQEARQVKSEDVTERLIREYEERIKTEPNNLKLVRSLAELYTQKKEFEKALSYYEMIKGSEMGGDASLDRAIAETKVRRFEHQISQLDPSAPDYTERVAALQAEKQAFQLAECQKRVERFPNDLQFRFELGQLYLQAGKIGEAIQEFQKAQSNPHRRIAAMNCLAQCFAKRKMYDLAARTLENALKEKLVFDDEKKELIYNLGCVLDNMGKKDAAVEQYKLIYEVDIGYRDVSAKVDAYYANQ